MLILPSSPDRTKTEMSKKCALWFPEKRQRFISAWRDDGREWDEMSDVTSWTCESHCAEAQKPPIKRMFDVITRQWPKKLFLTWTWITKCSLKPASDCQRMERKKIKNKKKNFKLTNCYWFACLSVRSVNLINRLIARFFVFFFGEAWKSFQSKTLDR